MTGRAAYAADTTMPGMIWGKVLRSPHPHARIKSIDTSKAEAHPGVKAVMTAKDIVNFPLDKSVMLGIQDMRWMCRNVMAREKALFAGHPVAAVAATTEKIAAEACKLIEVEYEVLPFVIDVEEAMKPDAPILHDFIKYKDKPSNIAGTLEHKLGDIGEGFAKADVVDRAQLPHPAGASGLYRAACLPGQRLRRQGHDLELQPGPVHGPRHVRLPDGAAAERHPRHPRRDRRRLRRQDHHLPGAAGPDPGQEVRPSGEDDHEPCRGLPCLGPDLGLLQHGQAGCDQGRQAGGRAGHLLPAGRRAAGLAHPRRGGLRLRAL